jgi:hypothetical protein
MTRCKNCKYFDNTKPVSMSRGNDKYKSAENYIGRCKITGTVKMMNDQCYADEALVLIGKDGDANG